MVPQRLPQAVTRILRDTEIGRRSVGRPFLCANSNSTGNKKGGADSTPPLVIRINEKIIRIPEQPPRLRRFPQHQLPLRLLPLREPQADGKSI